MEAAGATLRFLPPYSCDFNPIEAAWALIKKCIRAVAPRTASALRCTVQRARHVVRPRHCRNWFAHAGYQVIDGVSCRRSRSTHISTGSEAWLIDGWGWLTDQ